VTGCWPIALIGDAQSSIGWDGWAVGSGGCARHISATRRRDGAEEEGTSALEQHLFCRLWRVLQLFCRLCPAHSFDDTTSQGTNQRHQSRNSDVPRSSRK